MVGSGSREPFEIPQGYSVHVKVTDDFLDGAPKAEVWVYEDDIVTHYQPLYFTPGYPYDAIYCMMAKAAFEGIKDLIMAKHMDKMREEAGA